MRRLFMTAAAAAVLAISPSVAEAQVGFGATAAYHEDADFGLGGFVTFPLTALHQDMEFLGEVLYFFVDEDTFGEDASYIEINPGLRWNFPLADNPGLTPFALGGLNIARADFGDFGDDTEVGLNLGGGVTFGSGSLRPSVGARFELSGGEGFVLFGSIALGG